MSTGSRPPELFVLATGQDDNIGDVVLRREYFDRLRAIGRMHLFVGSSSDDFVSALCLDEADEIYVSLRDWHSAAWRALFRGSVWFVEKPGELQLDKPTLRRQLKLLPLIVGTRIRNGHVLRLGLAMRSVAPPHLGWIRLLFRLSTMICWRDTATAAAFGYGTVGPDWAFGWRRPAQDKTDLGRADIAISFRADRNLPSDAILDTLIAFARDSGRRLVVVTQVRRDTARSSDLASRLGAELVAWPAGRTLEDHENSLREVYRRCALVVSDRLHALIMGMTEGAVPLCITDFGEPKVERHFDAIGFGETSIRWDVVGPGLTEMLIRQVDRHGEAYDAIQRARDSLDAITAQLVTSAKRHVGNQVG